MTRGDALRRMNELVQEMASLAREVWGPKEGLATRLETGTRGGEPALFADGDVLRPASRLELQAAADLYNRRGAIEEVAKQLRRSQLGLLIALADRLEGKE